MNKRAERALRGSIRKWERIVLGEGADYGDGNCPLCRQFMWDVEPDTECRGCPVYETTGLTHCKRSPYTAWIRAWRQEYRSYFGEGFPPEFPVVIGPKTMKAAIAEHDFLVSLLP